MSNLQVRKTETGQQLQPATREYSPLRLMREMFGWDPFQEMEPMPAFNRLTTFNPAFEVKETKDQYLFRADVPGLKETDLEINLTGNRLTISGKREDEKEEKTDSYYTCERTYGSFTRAFTLPDGADVDHISSNLKSGVLTIGVPKKAEVQAKKIPVNATKS